MHIPPRFVPTIAVLHLLTSHDYAGELEPDYEAWPDHDERCHGPIDTDDNKREFPDSFEWSCCQTNGGDLYHHSDVDSTDEDYDEERFGAGCHRGRHCEE
jgi:hypothetical protein